MGKAEKSKSGRKPNTWSLVAFKDIADHLTKEGTPITAFVKLIGVSNQTFHNWKNNRCAPTVEVQQKIKDAIAGITPGEKEPSVAKKKTAKKKVTKKKKTSATLRAPRGKGSTSLAALTASSSGGTAPAEAAPAPAKKKTKKKAGRRPGPRKPAAATPAAEGNGTKTEMAPAKAAKPRGRKSSWKGLSTLGEFLRSNRGKSREELIEVLDMARELSA